jgi:hypothetical protein
VTMTADRWCQFHKFMVIVWIVLAVPTVLWWKESILWVAFLSLYANAATHFSAWQAARAERASE